MMRVKDLVAIMAIMIVFMFAVLYLETSAITEEIYVQETTQEISTNVHIYDGYYPVTITIDDNYKDIDFETLKTHFKSNYNAKLISVDEGIAEIEIPCEEAEIDNIRERLEGDYLVQGYEILGFKRRGE